MLKNVKAACESGQHITGIGGTLTIVQNPPEDWIAAAWLKFKEAGLLETIWHQGVPTLSWFLNWCKAENCILYAGLFKPDNEDVVHLCGLGWCVTITPIAEYFKAEVGMAFLPEWQHHHIPAELAEMMIDDAFENQMIILMVGTTPVKNKLAARFIRKAGFKELCVIPHYATWQGEPCDTIISALTVEDWSAPKRSEG